MPINGGLHVINRNRSAAIFEQVFTTTEDPEYREDPKEPEDPNDPDDPDGPDDPAGVKTT